MIKRLSDINDYLVWIEDYLYDSCFSSPFCDKERVISVTNKPNHILFGSFKDEILTGIYSLMVLDDEKTIETIYMYSKDKNSYEELMSYLSENYCGYEVWLVFNPKNYLLKNCLLERNAFFYTEQRYMDYQGKVLLDSDEIIPYCADYKDEYIRIHNNDGYWNGEKIIEQIDRFDIFLCIKGNHLVGYLDLSKGNSVVEIMDILVLPEYRNQGIGTLLLQKAIAKGSGKRLILTVDVDNDAANHLYEKIGFREITKNNCITARYVL